MSDTDKMLRDEAARLYNLATDASLANAEAQVLVLQALTLSVMRIVDHFCGTYRSSEPSEDAADD